MKLRYFDFITNPTKPNGLKTRLLFNLGKNLKTLFCLNKIKSTYTLCSAIIVFSDKTQTQNHLHCDQTLPESKDPDNSNASFSSSANDARLLLSILLELQRNFG